MKGSIKHIILPLVAFLLSAMFAVSCQLVDMVHEFPEKGKEVDPTIIKTHVRLQLALSQEIAAVITKSAIDEDGKYDRRYIVEIRNAEYSDDLVESHVITRDASDTSALIIDTQLHALKYKICIWSDFVNKGSKEDLYYYTGNGTALNAVHVTSRDKYVAGTDYKATQTAIADVDLTPYHGQWFVDVTIPVQLYGPMAKITFLASDISEYAKTSGSTLPLGELASQLSNSFSFSGYLPTGFNVLTGRLNDSEVSYGFKSVGKYPYLLNDVEYTLVGFDYVFVNGESSSVTLDVKITKKDGTIVNIISDIVVPIYRGKETVVIYKFYTKDYVPGIGINPEFDGEFNVYV